jgi:glycerol-3-phosphate acyltransferase PlsY
VATYLAVTLVAYLLGSIPSGVIVSRQFAGRDVRGISSGHTGALNTYRAAGLAPAVFTFLADAGKVVLALEFARRVATGEWGLVLASVAALVGHCWPVYTGLRGGMGLTPAGTALFLLDGPILFALLVLWFPLRYAFKRSARATIGIAILLPILLVLSRVDLAIVVFGLVAGAILTCRHLGDWGR